MFRGSPMTATQWTEQAYFAGLDWARSHHDLVLIDRHGQVQQHLRFEHTLAGWQQVRELVQRHPELPVAVETSQGTVVEHLVAAGLRVYPVNPKAAERYRERQAPSGVKDDGRDAWSLADALRLDGQTWRAFRSQDDLTAELQLLCRDEIGLIEQRTAFINQLQQCLHEYYPAALEAFDDWTSPGAWALVQTFPTPQQLQQAGPAKWEEFLHTHQLWRTATRDRRLAVFAQAGALCGTAPTIAAKQLLATTLANLLQTLQTQLEAYRAQIRALFGRHPDHDLFDSLPGAGDKLAPRLLAEIGAERSRFDSAVGLQCLAGTAPVTRQTGQGRGHQQLRRACNLTLRSTVHLWADHSRHHCAWAQAYYDAHKKQGQSHACALRCLGQRWLKILFRMWQLRTPYDEALHTRHQTQHGSWVLTLLPAPQNP